MPQKGALWADNGVDLAHRFHDLEVVVVELGGHQVYIPHREVGVEEDDSFHCQLGEVGEVLEEARHNDRVGGQGKLCLDLRVRGDKSGHLQVLQQQVLQHNHYARDQAEAD